MLDWLAGLDIWLSFLLGAAAIFVAAELGRCIGSVRRRRRPDAISPEIIALQTATIGLLALLIGFTFAMTLSRYDARLKVVLDEASAIGTAALRAEALPEPHPNEVRTLLRDYVQVRIDRLRHPEEREGLDATTLRSKALQRELWQHAVAVNAADPRSVIGNLFMQALNEMIVLQERRLFAARDRVPEAVFLLLYAIAMVSLGFAGYAAALEGKQGRIPYSIMAVLVACVIGLVADLDRAQSGLITINQQPLLDLQENLAR